MWELQSNPHLRIGPKWYTVATFATEAEARKYLDDHRDRLIIEESTEDFQIVEDE